MKYLCRNEKFCKSKVNFSAYDDVQRQNWITTIRKKEIHNFEKTKMKFQTLCTDTAEAVH